MARNRTASITLDARTGKRQAGYLVTIKGFVPVNRESFAEQRAALDAMEAASKGDPAAALALMTGLTVAQKFTTRVVETPAASE